jgi:hypothetical protein
MTTMLPAVDTVYLINENIAPINVIPRLMSEHMTRIQPFTTCLLTTMKNPNDLIVWEKSGNELSFIPSPQLFLPENDVLDY